MVDESVDWRERFERERAARLAVEELLRDVSRRPHQDLLSQERDEDAHTLAGRQRDFLDVVSHELRTPLTIINGSLHILQMLDDGSDGQRTKVLGTANRATERLVRIVQNVETWTNLQSPYHQWGTAIFDLEPLLVRVAAAAAPDRGARIDVERDTAVAASGDLLERCLANLVHNAVTYGEPPVTIEARRRDHGIEVAVVDHGPGLPQDRPDLFRAFTQGDAGERRTSTGLGLGLSIVFGAARRFGWRFTHHRADGASRFALLLPPLEMDIDVRGATSRREAGVEGHEA